MRVLVLNGSPGGENSITLQTVRFIESRYQNTRFETLHVGKRIKSFEKDFSEAAEALARADLILFCYPVYTFLVPAQLHRFIELIWENEVDLSGKYATQISTSKHFYDVTAHRFIQDNCMDLGMKYIKGLSADMEDLLKKRGQKEALDFFRYVRWNMKHGYSEPCYAPAEPGNIPSVQGNITAEPGNIPGDPGRPAPTTGAAAEAPLQPGIEKGIPAKSGTSPDGCDGKKMRIAIVADLLRDNSVLQEMVDFFAANCGADCDVINIREFPFKGGCLGCFNCAADGTCIYTDGFDRLLRERIQEADAFIYAFAIQNHSMGSRFKMFDDRQFCNGHRTVTMGKPVGYLIEGDLTRETNLQMLIEARSQVGGNFLAGIACSGQGQAEQMIRLAKTLEFAVSTGYDPPANFYGVGGMKIFRDLIYQMQGLMREDHRFYKEHHFYDFPQKKKGTIVGMYLVGAMMTNKKLKKKMGSKMREGMMMPYRNVLEKPRKTK